MQRATDILWTFLQTRGEMGGPDDKTPFTHGGSENAIGRTAGADLGAALRAGLGDARRVLQFWALLTTIAFALLLYATSLRLLEPYLVVPAGCAGLFWLLRRVESIWREVRLQSLSLQLALACNDPAMLREVMTVLHAALLADGRKRAAEPLPGVGELTRGKAQP